MPSIKNLVARLKHLLANPYMRNVGWLGSAELLNRLTRLGMTVFLARMFTRQDYGLVAIIYTLFDFANMLTFRGGIGAKVIQVDEANLNTICNTSYWLSWIFCSSIFILQCVISIPIAYFYNNLTLIPLLCVSALFYLMLPLYQVQYALIERENRLKIIALCEVGQSLLSNGIVVIGLLLGLRVWAVAWAMVLSTPVWIVLMRLNHPWRPARGVHLERWQEVVHFGKNLLGVELLIRLRGNLDYLMIGRTLGLDALGIYYFAFNAGVGISLNVINKFMMALFPYICEVRSDYAQFKQNYYSSLKRSSLVIIPLVLCQSLLAPIYVPLVFGQKWQEAIPILMIICLSVIPRLYMWSSTILLNAIDKTHIMLRIDALVTLIFIIFIVVSLQWNILGVAIAVLLFHYAILPAFIIWVHQYAFNEQLHFKPEDQPSDKVVIE